MTPRTLIENHQSKIKPLVGSALAFGVLFFLTRVVIQTWDEIVAAGFNFEFDVPPLLVSLILLVIARGFAVEAWRRILISLGEYFSFGFGARVWFLSNLTRYIPGNLWQVATMMAMVEARGVSKTNALLSQVLYTALALAIAGWLGFSFLLVRPEVFRTIVPVALVPWAPFIIGVTFTLLIILFALPITQRLIVATTARLTHRSFTTPRQTFTRGLVPPLFSSLMWLTNGIAFFLFTHSIVPLSFAQLPAFIAMNAGAYWIGYISFLTPSGLGVREGALALMLTTFFPTPVAVGLALVTRLWSTAGELLGASLILLAYRERAHSSVERGDE